MKQLSIGVLRNRSSFLDVRNFVKYTYEEVPFLAKLRLQAYNFTKNELLCRYFSNNFT